MSEDKKGSQDHAEIKRQDNGREIPASSTYSHFLAGLSKRSPQEIIDAAKRDEESIEKMLSDFPKSR